MGETLNDQIKQELLKNARENMHFAEIEVRAIYEPKHINKQLIYSGLEIWWDMVWRWHYRFKFGINPDWTQVLGETSIKDPESIEAAITSPYIILSDQVSKERRLTSKQLAQLFIKEELFNGNNPRHTRDILARQLRKKVEIGEIWEARKLQQEQGVKLFDCWFSPDQPILACPWPRES